MKLAALAACFAFGLPAAALADAPDQATQQSLLANYQLACAAALNPTDQALQTFFGMLAPTFTSTNITGDQVSRAQIVNQFGAQLKMFHTTTCDEKITSAQTAPDGTILATNVLHLSGSAPMEGPNHTFSLILTSQDTWSNASGRWLIASQRQTHLHLEMDGSVLTDQGS
jgi:hypothetical protein